MKIPVGVWTRDDGSYDLEYDTAVATARSESGRERGTVPRAEDALPYGGVCLPYLGDPLWVPGMHQPIWTDEALEDLAEPPKIPTQSSCELNDCAASGCWCPSFGADAFHCNHCQDPYDSRYECAVYARMCVGCCGHSSCRGRWEELTYRSGLS